MRQQTKHKNKNKPKNGGKFYVYDIKKITNNDAKNIISYNAGVYGWNYSIGYYSTRLDKYVICGYRIPQSVLNAAKSVIKLSQKEAYLHA